MDMFMDFWNSIIVFWNQYSAQFLQALGQHIYMTVVSVVIAIIIGIPLGIISSYYKRIAKVIMAVINVVQAIPSLAILGFLIPFLGIGSAPAIFMVTMYSLLPIVKNTYTGITNISPAILESADGMGMTWWQRLFKVEVPLAMPVIVSGIRISAVSAVGLMTIAAFVGGGGLGYFIFTGVSLVNNTMILFGAIPAAILALSIDALIQWIEKRMTLRNQNHQHRKGKKRHKGLWIGLAAVLAVSAIGGTVYMNQSNSDKTIAIGSKKFTESMILCHMLADLIEAHTDLTVDRKLSLGGSKIVFEGVTSGQIDGYVEYSGTAYVTYMNNTFKPGMSAEAVFDELKTQLADIDLTAMAPLGFENRYAFAVRADIAEKYNLTTTSELAAVSPELNFISTMEFQNREDGFIGANKVYNFNFKGMNAADDAMRYTAVDSGAADASDVFTTDGLIAKYNMKVLEDDKHFFAPYTAFPIFRTETLAKHPELTEVLNMLENAISDEEMRELNYKVIVEGQKDADVARDFLLSKGLI
ncbi:ABC transporter permease/substrate-binding protein [Culicoidibacter larvae]|nr:ABC transporter permease/substrate-binding protein [Culicoidibacter larvae]